MTSGRAALRIPRSRPRNCRGGISPPERPRTECRLFLELSWRVKGPGYWPAGHCLRIPVPLLPPSRPPLPPQTRTGLLASFHPVHYEFASRFRICPASVALRVPTKIAFFYVNHGLCARALTPIMVSRETTEAATGTLDLLLLVHLLTRWLNSWYVYLN